MHRNRLAQRVPALLRRLERRLGAERPGRSLWVWAIPVATTVVTFVLCLIVAIVGQLGWWIAVPLSMFGALYMGTTAAVNLTSGAPDAQDPDEGGGGGGGGTPDPAPEPRRPAGGVAMPVSAEPGRTRELVGSGAADR